MSSQESFDREWDKGPTFYKVPLGKILYAAAWWIVFLCGVLTASAQTPSNNATRIYNVQLTPLTPDGEAVRTPTNIPPQTDSIHSLISSADAAYAALFPATNQTALVDTNKLANLWALPFKELKKKAEAGDADAQAALGACYAYGHGVSKDYNAAVIWARKSSEQCNVCGQYELGHCYEDGLGVDQDYSEAVKWYRKAAEQGYAAAQFSLGVCCYKGQGVSQDHAEAAKWFRKAADQGDADSQRNLGVCYYNGQGVPQDHAEAVKWYRRAAEQNQAEAQYNLAECYYNGNGVPKDHAETLKWSLKAAEQGHSEAAVLLGQCYGEQTNVEEAVRWYRQAAKRGEAEIQDEVAFEFFYGRGIPKDQAEGFKWYLKAAERGLARAQSSVGQCYDRGKGVPQDYTEAVKWYRKAAEQGDESAQYDLGDCYESGKGVPQDYVEAFKWYNLAASRNQFWAGQRDRVATEMTPDQIAEGQRRASQFVARHGKAAAGDQSIQPDAAAMPKGNGTGFLITEGYIVTSYHVVSDATTIKIVMDGSLRGAKLIKADPANDLALLQVAVRLGDILSSTAPRSLPIVSSRDVKLGDSVITLGFPNIGLQGVEPKLTRGEINSLSGIQDDLRLFQMSVAVQPGNSGGPLVDMRGNVIGIVAARLNDQVAFETSGALPQNVNYAVKSSFILAFLDSVPELAGNMKEPHTEKERQFNDVVKEVQQATVMVIVY